MALEHHPNKTHIIMPPSFFLSLKMGIAVFLFLATLLSASHAKFDVTNPIRQQTQPRFRTDSCLSWRVAVEAHNMRDWITVPEPCLSHVKNYVRFGQYDFECYMMADAAVEFAKSFKIAGDGKDVWVFDIDETLLSNLLYLGGPDFEFGAKPLNATSFYEWIAAAEAPALPAVQYIYNTVLSLGFKTVILTGAPEFLRQRRILNLHRAGYYNWESLILRGDDDLLKSQLEYKSEKRTELVNQGYRIVGNVGDQWSDLTGTNIGNRTFKVPNPMYYAP